MGQIDWNGANRRTLLKGLGLGAVGLPLATGTGAAGQDSLQVYVEPGEGDIDAWVSRAQDTIADDDFQARLEITGIQGDEIAYMIVPTNPAGGFIDEIKTGINTTDGKNEGALVHDDPWYPENSIPFVSDWEAGTYYLYAAVADSERETFAAAISEPFEIDN